MKQLITAALITLTLLSCTKEKQAAIVGGWKETAIYHNLNPTGDYKWEQVLHGFPYLLSLSGDGTYSDFQCTPLGGGIYQYDYASKQLRFEAIPTGRVQVVSVTFLDDDNLVFDYGMTSMGEYKVKFTRTR